MKKKIRKWSVPARDMSGKGQPRVFVVYATSAHNAGNKVTLWLNSNVPGYMIDGVEEDV